MDQIDRMDRMDPSTTNTTTTPSPPSPPDVKEIHNPGTMLLLTILVAVLFQIAIYHWQRKHQRSFLMVSLAGLWLVPFGVSVALGNWRFVAVWSVYLLVNAVLLRCSTRKPVDPSTPRVVYRFYHVIFQLTLALGILGYAAFLTNTFLILSTTLFDASITAIFYAVYFGVLSRDMIDLASDLMASSLGYYSRTGFPEKHLRPFVCAICGGNVDKHTVVEQAEAATGLLSVSERSVTLDCQHTFHDYCLRGWSLIGKKDHCPYCKEKVDMTLFKANPWKDPEFVYGRFLDFMRYLIVWQPILLSLFNIVFYITGN